MKKIVESVPFKVIVFAIILLNAIVLGLESIPEIQDRYGNFLNTIDSVCLGLFVGELICRICAHRLSFFRSGWNLFDFIVVGLSFATAIDGFSSLRVVRLLKELRALRLLSSLKTLQRIITAIVRSLPSLGYATLLMIILFYVYAIIGVNLYGGAGGQANFASLGDAMLSLFVAMTFEGWSDLMYGVMDSHPHAWIYFVSFVVFSAIIMLNIVVGIAVNFVSEAYEQKDESQSDIKNDIEMIESKLKELKKKIG